MVLALTLGDAMTDVTTFYAPYFKAWQVKQMGEKPTAKMLEQVHGLGCRPGKQALAIAMSLRPTGVTGAQIVMVCGAPQLNKMRGLVSDGHLKRLPAAATDGTNHTVYHNEVTPKGLKRIEARAAADAKARLDDGSSKLKAAKATKRVKKLINDAKAKAGDPKQRAPRKRPAKPEVPAAEVPTVEAVPVAPTDNGAAHEANPQ